jgi:hypothetical protein
MRELGSGADVEVEKEILRKAATLPAREAVASTCFRLLEAEKAAARPVWL